MRTMTRQNFAFSAIGCEGGFSRKNRELNLPPANTKRWVASRKEQVLQALDKGYLSEEAACRIYKLSTEELSEWRRLRTQHGKRGLFITKAPQRRK